MANSADTVWLSEQLWLSLRSDLRAARREIVIVAPYIGLDPTEKLLAIARPGVGITVITSLDARSLASGALSLRALLMVAQHPTGAVRSIQRLHAKVYVVDWSRCWWGSANFTRSGLGTSGAHNVELLSRTKPIPAAVQRVVRTVLLSSDAVSQEHLSRLEDILHRSGELSPSMEGTELEEACFGLSASASATFLFQQLPFSDTPTSLLQAPLQSEEVKHDFMILGLKAGDSLEANLGRCRERYRQIPIVEALLELLSKPRHFGYLTRWLHERCEDRPVPYRSEVKELLSRTLEWLVELYPEEVVCDRPGKRSVRYHRRAAK